MIMLQYHNFLNRLKLLVGEDGIQALKSKSVFILGIGGVGGYVCEALARSGVGRLVLVDSDIIDVTNINRQIIATHSTVGRKKVEVMKERIFDINPECIVEIYDLFLEDDLSILDRIGVDFVIDCCDTVSTKKNIISYCTLTNVPFITCLGTAKKFDPSLLEITELSKTYNDPLARILRKYVKDNHIFSKVPVCFSRELPANVERLGSTAFVPSSAGLLIASYVVDKFICNMKK